MFIKIIAIYLSDIYILEPIYNKKEEKLEWYAGPMLEAKESLTCPYGFEHKDSFCHGISIQLKY